MSQAQHTPGPWTYEGGHTHRQFNIRMLGHLIGTRDEAKHICTVNNLPPHVLANRDPVTAEANARLIAAAPDLLAALQYAAQFLADEVEQRGLAGSEMTDYQDEAVQALDRVEAAIANATGQPAP